MGRRIRGDHDWYELRGAHVRVSRTTRDCDMAEHRDNWRDAIKPGDLYAWMSHGLNVCAQHFSLEDVVDGSLYADSQSDGPADQP